MALVALAVDVALIAVGVFAVRRTMRRMLGAGFPLGAKATPAKTPLRASVSVSKAEGGSG